MNTRVRHFGVLLSAAMLALGCDNAPPPQTSTATPPIAPQPAPATAPAQGRWPFFDSADTAAVTGGVDAGVSLRRNYYVVFDASGSMSASKCSGAETKITVAKSALIQFADKLPADVNLGLSVFGATGIREVIALGPLQVGAVAQAITPIAAGGGTPLAESIQQAYAALSAQARKQLGYGEYHLVVITDGEASTADPRTVVNAILGTSPIVLHTIGFCMGAEHSLNQPGRVIYRAADNPAQLASSLADVLAEAPTFNTKTFK